MALRRTLIALLVAVARGSSTSDDWKQSLSAEQRASLEAGIARLQKKSQKEQEIAGQDGPKAQAFFKKEYEGKAQDLLQQYQKKAAQNAASATSEKRQYQKKAVPEKRQRKKTAQNAAVPDAPQEKANASALMLAAVPDADDAGASPRKQDEAKRDAAREADEEARRAARKADEAARRAARKADEEKRHEERREEERADSKAGSNATQALMLAAVPDADDAGTSPRKQDEAKRQAAREADEEARRAARKADEAARRAARKADEEARREKRREEETAGSRADSNATQALLLAAVPGADDAGTSPRKQDEAKRESARKAARKADEAARKAARKADEAGRRAARKADEAARKAARKADEETRREEAKSSTDSSTDAESRQNAATMFASMFYHHDASMSTTLTILFVAGPGMLAIGAFASTQLRRRRNRAHVALLDDAAVV